ncbi:hydrogenase nickel incorporation protein HypB [Azospirillum lipoferum]|uniref:Hydrogenase maturation factor HypB n=1 Tax=Azospirillum lipoferum TaxID=193 RepID=A0A5A9GSA7_AZOLI|nr:MULTISPECIES: hydrogenase nickel incorporation protein HypB [Azospirillum]KAA0596524.1 hydrogenase nickel incorporation protein HypB [Azospirillum lipoferum]MCP1610524.1 hydrogenase nickel incorporation protein HypB [Azospirillum lipoferum]MDW5538033.1 hydrogenase nickel incorporation protein HypB [Azospirillum sp. NL1]
MCTVCGCGEGETRIDGKGIDGKAADAGHEHIGPDGKVYRHRHGEAHHHAHHHHDDTHEHVAPDGTVFRHSHNDHGHPDHGHDHHHHDHGHTHDHHRPDRPDAIDGGAALNQPRLVTIERDILAKNDGLAAVNRCRFAERGVFVLNLMSSPGSGKTTLLTRSLTDLKGRFPVAVIEGDQQTSFDADRIRATGTPAVQVNTGKGCHLDASMVAQAADKLAAGGQFTADGVLFVENVGNLVCPAGFDLGETHRVVVLSVTEGEDKPLKYPDMFVRADLLVVNKIDLLPHLTFDVERMIGYAQRLNPSLAVIQLSATTGQGLEEWYDWIADGLAEARASHAASAAI